MVCLHCLAQHKYMGRALGSHIVPTFSSIVKSPPIHSNENNYILLLVDDKTIQRMYRSHLGQPVALFPNALSTLMDEHESSETNQIHIEMVFRPTQTDFFHNLLRILAKR